MYKIIQLEHSNTTEYQACGNQDAMRIAQESKLVMQGLEYKDVSIYEGQNLTGLYLEEDIGMFFALEKM